MTAEDAQQFGLIDSDARCLKATPEQGAAVKTVCELQSPLMGRPKNLIESNVQALID